MNMSYNIPYRFAKKSLKRLPEVLTLYYGHDMTVQEVAKELSISPITVSNLLKEYGKGLKKPTPSPKLTEYEVKEIRITFDMAKLNPKYKGKQGEIIERLAIEYRVKPACIQKIIKRLTWKDI